MCALLTLPAIAVWATTWSQDPSAAPDTPAGPGYELFVVLLDPARELVRCEALLSSLDGPLELGFGREHSYVTLEPRLSLEPAVLGAAPGTSLERVDAFTWRLDPGDATELRLGWEVVLDHRTQPEVVGRDEYEQPYVAAGHGMLVTGYLALAPQDGEALGVRFALPPGWAVEAPWPELEDGRFLPSSLDHLRHDLVAIGAWDVHRETVSGVDLSIAFAPGQRDLRQRVTAHLPAIVAEELRLFGVLPHERYLFLFGRPDQPMSYGGSPKAGSMTLFLASDFPVEEAEAGLVHLMAHEYHHTWMFSRCEPEDDLRFVMEGFTDWFAREVPWRLGLRTGASFREQLLAEIARADEALDRWDGSLADAGGPAFFSGGDAYAACYSGGYALAAWTELALRSVDAEFGVDEVLRRFYNDPAWDDGTKPTLDDWFERLETALGPELGALQRDAVTGADDVDWVALFEVVGLALGRTSEPLGPSPRANFDGTLVVGIDPDGAAGRLGLASGDRLLSINERPVVDERTARANWRPDDAGQIDVRFERDGEERRVAAAYPSRVLYELARDAVWPWEG